MTASENPQERSVFQKVSQHIFDSLRCSSPQGRPQRLPTLNKTEALKAKTFPCKVLGIETVKTQGLTVGPNSWTEDGAGWLNKEALEPVAFDHVNDPLQQPQGGKIIVT